MRDWQTIYNACKIVSVFTELKKEQKFIKTNCEQQLNIIKLFIQGFFKYFVQ